MSWEDLENLSAPPTEEEKADDARSTKAIVDDFVALFASERGRRVFDYLYARTVDKPTFIQPGAGVDGRIMQKFQDMREGENNMVRLIRSICNKGGVKL